ncbi:MAG: RHS repeat domain-containing protein, partial [Cyclobacteriaceae bacterium]
WRLDKKTTDQAGTDIVADYAYVPSGNGIGKVQQVNGKFLDITRQYEYDQYHRTKKTIETIEGQTFTSEYHYDEHGNIHQTDYDNNLTVTRNYNNLGFLNTVKANGKFVWARENLSAREDKYYLGNNILTTNTYDNYGFPDEFEASYTSPIQKYDYAFNIQTGNLRSRQEQNGIKESFGYDNLDRLTDIRHDNTEVLSMQYNLQDKHNMNSKDDMGDVFNYTQQGNAGVHAVTSIEGLAPDAENLPEHDITWTAFNKVDQIREPDNNKHMYFTYGPEQQRKKVQYVHNHWVYDRYYSGNCEKTITYGNERTVYYISGGSGPAAAWVKEGSDENLYYIHTDHLGSIRAITDQNRNIVARYSFDAWGNRRNPDTWQLTDNPDLSFTSRGFTGHEHIDEFGLINMNGRVYDPTIGQFLSPDNYVQLPDASLGFNRYSYALNNPLIYTDPSGELFGLAIAAFLLFTDVGYNVQKYMSPVAVNFDVNPGNDRQFIRVNTSVGVPQAILLSYRVHAGASYYFEDYDGSYKGWETRWGGEYAVNLGKTQIMYSSTKYNRRGTKFDQTRDVYKIGNPFRYLEVENDCDLRPFNLPFLPEKDMSDKHLTHQMKYNVFGSEVGLNLFTGEPDPNVTYFEGGKEYYGEGGITNPNEYRAGILYMKFGGVKLGINDELIRDKTQNPFHDKIGTPRFEVLEKKTRFYWEIGN